MSTAACLPIAADRAGPCVRTIFFEGSDFTGVTLGMQLRLAPEIPGAPLVDLGMAATANAEGLRLIGVTVENGVPTSQVVLRINETTMKDATKVPFSGEIGTASVLAYDLIGIFGQDKRRLCYGQFAAVPTVYGMDAAPAARPANYGVTQVGYATFTSARVTFSNGSVTVKIDGADLIGPLAAQAGNAADRAEAAREAVAAGLVTVQAQIDTTNRLAAGFDIGPAGAIELVEPQSGRTILAVTGRGGLVLPGESEPLQDRMRRIELRLEGSGYGSRWRLYTFLEGNAGVGTLKIYEGDDGVDFPIVKSANVDGLPAGASIRDPSVRYDPRSGLWWMICSLWSFSIGPAYNSFGLLRSYNGLDWTFVVAVPTVVNAHSAWAPEWVTDGTGRWCVIVSCNLDGAYDPDPAAPGKRLLKNFAVRPTRPDMATWEVAGQLTGAALPNNQIDTQIRYVGGLYVATVKNESTNTLVRCWSDALLGPYDQGEALAFGSGIEGPYEIPLPGGQTRIYYDRYTGSPLGLFFRPSYDGGLTYQAEVAVGAPVERHGSVLLI